MAPQENLTHLAEQAERDLNSYENKTGAHKTSPSDEAGVDTRVENKFPGAEVRYDQDLSTNAGYNKRIPPGEGGELDPRGRQTTGQWFEGKGGPEQKLNNLASERGGYNDNDIPGAPHSQHGPGPKGPLSVGADAVQSNIEGTQHNPRKEHFKGSDYYQQESVPDSISAEGNIPPASVLQASREAEVGGFK